VLDNAKHTLYISLKYFDGKTPQNKVGKIIFNVLVKLIFVKWINLILKLAISNIQLRIKVFGYFFL